MKESWIICVFLDPTESHRQTDRQTEIDKGEKHESVNDWCAFHDGGDHVSGLVVNKVCYTLLHCYIVLHCVIPTLLHGLFIIFKI